jgi:hypothetical protein
MAKYLEKQAIKELNEYRQKIFDIRKEAFAKFGIDVLDTDTLSSLSIHEVVSQYDTDYNINFSRNGEDAKSNGVLAEQKCSKIKKPSLSASFMFHAMGDLAHDRYVLVVRQEEDLKLLRIYDISTAANVKLVQDQLFEQRRAWLAKGKLDESKMKRDVITVTEKFLLDNLKNTTRSMINDCVVIKA